MANITREDLRLELAGINYLDGLFTGVAADDGTNVQLSNLLVDGSYDGLKNQAYDADRFGNAMVYIPNGTNGEDEQNVFAYDPYVGSLQPGAAAYRSVPVSGTTKYEVHTHGLRVKQLHDAINWACRNASYYDTIVLPGLLPDIDDASAWTANSGGITETIVTDTDGKLSMRTVNTVDDAYIKTAAVNVIPNRSYSFYITLQRFIAGTFEIQAWNFAAGTRITTVNPTLTPDIVDGASRRYLAFSVQIPDDCYSVELRIVGTTPTSQAYWREWGFRYLGDNLPLPTWMNDPMKQILAPGVQTLAVENGSYTGGLLTEASPLAPEGLTLPDSGWYGRVFLNVARPFSPLTSDTSTVPEDVKDWILTGALVKCYEALSRPRAVDAGTYRQLHADTLRKWLNKCSVRNPARKWGHPVWSTR